MSNPIPKSDDDIPDESVTKRFCGVIEEMMWKPSSSEMSTGSLSIAPGDSLTLAAMIAACRFTRPPNPDINERNFPLTGSPVADVADMLTVSQKDLGGQNMTTSEIEAAIDRKGFRPATLAEQLVYAKEKWNGKDWIAALGSSWVGPGGFRGVPYLFEGDGGRLLLLYWGSPECRWLGVGLFLVVRK
ncbi:MAG: hypothetical protein AAB554_03345 [Patescibacteria group bacterium]